MIKTKPIIGITMGDASGVGPEIVAKALSSKEIYSVCRPLVIGDAGLMNKGLEVANLSLEINSVQGVEEARFEYGVIDVLDLRNILVEKIEMGRVNAMAGKAAAEFIIKAVRLALDERIHAITTAPISKESMNKAGYDYAGHTELLASLTNAQNYAMMLIAGSLRVSHVTTHVSLKDACALINKERILEVIKLTHRALQDFGIKEPRIGVASLNPHRGEGGLFGAEEITEIVPAVNSARRMGFNVDGPIPADTVFVKAKGGAFDAVVAMYHDQGHIPVKLVGLEWNERDKKWKTVSGVNTTIGLPIIRTSVDHGTAFGKAGKGTANPQSIIEAIKLAAKMAKVRFFDQTC